MKLQTRAASSGRRTGSFRLAGAAAALGVVIGIATQAVQGLVGMLQQATLGISAEHAVLRSGEVSSLRLLLALCAGAILITLLDRVIASRRPVDAIRQEPVDAIEANAMRGGRMQAWDGIAVVLPILASVGSGTSVGIEAAVTQIGAVTASLLGVRLGFGRPDIRVLVAAGAAAAIAGAYRAPIAGMLYAFELVLGNYTKRTLAPISFAAVLATVVTSLLGGSPHSSVLPMPAKLSPGDVPLAVMVGGVAALAGICLMVSVTALEGMLRTFLTSGLTRRLAGAGLLAILARRYPLVLGTGHAAIGPTIRDTLQGSDAVQALAAKGVASAASLASGFRGGLFSASLLIGALLGQVFACGLAILQVGWSPDPGLCALIGMGAVGASVVGSPLAMTFIVVETTGGYEPIVAVAVGAVTASFLTDRLFGYSFATWRFQQRGLVLGGGQDVSRLAATPIASVIRPPKRHIRAAASLDEVLRATSCAGGGAVSVHTAEGDFLGLIDPSLIEMAADERKPLPIVAGDLVYAPGLTVTSSTTLAEVINRFRDNGAPSLAVVDPSDQMQLMGCVRAEDAFALASTILEAQRRDDLGLA